MLCNVKTISILLPLTLDILMIQMSNRYFDKVIPSFHTLSIYLTNRRLGPNKFHDRALHSSIQDRSATALIQLLTKIFQGTTTLHSLVHSASTRFPRTKSTISSISFLWLDIFIQIFDLLRATSFNSNHNIFIDRRSTSHYVLSIF
jgi:hypothetical protein